MASPSLAGKGALLCLAFRPPSSSPPSSLTRFVRRLLPRRLCPNYILSKGRHGILFRLSDFPPSFFRYPLFFSIAQIGPFSEMRFGTFPRFSFSFRNFKETPPPFFRGGSFFLHAVGEAHSRVQIPLFLVPRCQLILPNESFRERSSGRDLLFSPTLFFPHNVGGASLLSTSVIVSRTPFPPLFSTR